MADRLSIYKGALRLLGPSNLASLTEDRPERHRLDDAWEPAVNDLLNEGMWNFAMCAVELEQDEDIEPRFGFTYAFRKPDDWVRTVGISYTPTFNDELREYEDEGDYWYANVETLYLRYVSNDEAYGWNIGRWRQPFASALEARLAFDCGLPISGDRGNRNDLFQLYEKRLKRAKTLDAVDERVRSKPVGALVRSRFRFPSRSRDF